MINKKNVLRIMFMLLFLLMLVSILFNIGFLGYFDELLACICIVYIIYKLCCGNRTVGFIFILLSIISLLGLIGNITRPYCKDISNILLDMFMLIKPYSIFAGTLLFLRNNYDERYNDFLIKISKVLIIIIFGGLLLFLVKRSMFSIGGKYVFTTTFTGSLANCITLMIAIIYSKKDKYNEIYWLLAMVCMFFNGSGLGMLGLLIFFFFNILPKYLKLSKMVILIFGIIGVCISLPEITAYLLDTSAPRSKMFYYAFTTANRFLPFGSGFGTYGSYVAVRDYSLLYYEYGFNKFWGMTPTDTKFLFDTYYPMIIAQFGYIGLILYIVLMYKIYIKFVNFKGKDKNNILAVFLYIILMGLGFNIGGAEGSFTFGVLAYLICKKRHEIIDSNK